MLLSKDELEHIESVSFAMFEEFNDGEDILLLLLLLLLLSALLIFIGGINKGRFVLEFEFKSLMVLFIGVFI